MRDVLRREAHDALVHRLQRIGDDVADGVREGFLVDVDLRQVAREKILGADHGAAQDFANGLLHSGLERGADFRRAFMRRDGEHLLDEVAGRVAGRARFH